MFYEKAIRQIIKEGGDTDTNACIAGGMIGALVGVKRLNKDMYAKVLNFNCTMAPYNGLGRFRPEFLSASKYLLPLVKNLIEIRPKDRVIIQK